MKQSFRAIILYSCLLLSHFQIKLIQPQRSCFHPGSTSLAREGIKLPKNAQDVTSSHMIKVMLTYIWPKVGFKTICFV